MSQFTGPTVHYVYILRCRNNAYYVGHTRNLEERVKAHNEGRGAAYTADNAPVHLVYSEPHADQRSAMNRERQLKKWTRAKKEALIHGDPSMLHQLAQRQSRLRK